MKKHIIYLFLFSVLLGAYSCYKDKGNYDYKNINKITIKSTADTFNVMLPDSLRIDLTITQTLPDPAGLSFQWVLYPNTSAPLTRRTLDSTQNLRAKITEDPGPYLLDVFVKDRKTNVEFQKRFVINVLTIYSEGWVVVEEAAGSCDLSMISPLDVVFKNIYSQANNGQTLPAGTFRIPDIKTTQNEQKVFILSPNNLQQVNFSNFLKIANPADVFWAEPSPLMPQEMFFNSTDEVAINNGKPHFRSLNAPGIKKFNQPPVGNYYMAPFEFYNLISGYFFYDTIGRKFIRLDVNSISLQPMNAAPAGSLFDLNNIGKRILYGEVASGFKATTIFKNVNNDSLFAFVLDPTLTNPAVSRYDGLIAPGITTAKFFTMSRLLPHLYYASGNQIYKLDIPAKTAAPVYTFPAGTEIRAMKMYRNMKTSSDPNHNKLIAVATKEGGQGKVYYFPIAATGDFTGNTYSKVFTGFGQINEITFKSQK